MEFNPQYTRTDRLLKNISDINRLIGELNNKRFSSTVLYKLSSEAKYRSTHSSTSIEGNPLGLTDVKKLLKSNPKNLKTSEKEVLNYNEALTYLESIIKDEERSFNKELVLKIQKLVTKDLLSNSYNGKYRDCPVVINNPLLRKFVYIAPDFKDVEILMRELISFVKNNRNNLDPLILAGLFHKQFVVIHPFVDGNGRSCRLLTKFLLADLGIDTFELFSFENFYNNNVSKYFERVGVFGDYYDLDIDYTDWLEYFTDGILDEILRVKKILDKGIYDPQESILRDGNKIIEYIQINGYITDKKYSELTDRAKATRVIDFNKLIDRDIIERRGRGRGTYYVIKD